MAMPNLIHVKSCDPSNAPECLGDPARYSARRNGRQRESNAVSADGPEPTSATVDGTSALEVLTAVYGVLVADRRGRRLEMSDVRHLAPKGCLRVLSSAAP